jgi:hypothetical protein
MKNIFALTIAAALAGCAAPHAPREFNFGGLESGIVEGAREVPRDIHAFAEAIEHRINPETAGELLIRLNDGRTLTVLEDGMRRFAPGERVRIVAGRVERE